MVLFLGVGIGFDVILYIVILLVINNWYGWEEKLVGVDVYVSGFLIVFKVVFMIFDIYGLCFFVFCSVEFYI